MITLISRTRGDGWAFIRDSEDSYCLIMPPYRISNMILVEEDAARRSITECDYIPCEKSFANWKELIFYMRRALAM